MVVVVLLPFLSILISFLFVFSSDREMVRLNRSAFLDATNFASKESFANCVRNATTMASESPSSPPSCRNVPSWRAQTFCARWTKRRSVCTSRVDIDARSVTCMNTIATVSSLWLFDGVNAFILMFLRFFSSRRISLLFLSGSSYSSFARSNSLGFAFRASFANFSHASPNSTLSYRP